jgi:hypothetical protein
MTEKTIVGSTLTAVTLTPITWGRISLGPTLSISTEGVTYKGKLIEDAGECYAAIMEFLKQDNERLK